MGGRNNDDRDGGSDEQQWVFDERFVAGGIREDSLRRPPPSGPRNALGNPAGPRDWTPTRPGGSTTSPRRRLRVVLVVLAAAVGVLSLVRFAASSDDGPTTIAAPSGTGLDSGVPADLREIPTRIGTCLSGSAPADGPVDVHPTSCRTPHDFELVGVERASGSDDTYPAESYWDGPVAQRCYADLRRWTGQPRDRWPGYLTSTSFIPRRDGWAAGDREVRCLAQLAPARAGSVRHLRAVRPAVIGTSAAASEQPSEPSDGGVAVRTTSLTGRLTVLIQGSDVCLGVRTSTGTTAVVTSAPGLSWSAYVDAGGRPVAARSGIARAAHATPDTIDWHPGDRVALTGGIARAEGAGCGATSLLAVDTVRTAG